MAVGRSQFVGAAGQFYLSYGLSVREIIASITIGNAPSVDVLASSQDGQRTLSFQVKTSRSAYRKKRYGREGFEWDVGASVIGKQDVSFWYAFVDLQESAENFTPRVFFAPSKWVAEFVRPGWSRSMFFLPQTAFDISHERWDLVMDFLEGGELSRQWASSWPEDKLVRWGVSPTD